MTTKVLPTRGKPGTKKRPSKSTKSRASKAVRRRTAKRQTPQQVAKVLGLQACNALALVEKVETGLSYRAFERFCREIDLPKADVARLVQIKPNTLSRRKVKGRLQPHESDRLVRASRILTLATSLFEGDTAAARQWLLTPKRALGRRSPLDMAKTEVGAREVERLVNRLEHGVFS